ncbi:hypothetical protein F5883DRAFT_560497 [Diaporthe sp. PMI_573]|nr:hypothetical protein F5883DRAFT_560497 [Diaporthaceae sp. PMI_573]
MVVISLCFVLLLYCLGNMQHAHSVEMMLAADIMHVNQDAMNRYSILSTPCSNCFLVLAASRCQVGCKPSSCKQRRIDQIDFSFYRSAFIYFLCAARG